MLKTKKIGLIILFFLATTSSIRACDTLVFPIKQIFGYGGFFPRLRMIKWDHKPSVVWAKMDNELKGLPTNWTKLTIEQIVLDLHQFVFQNYKQGNIKRKEIYDVLPSWENETFENLSSTPINCFLNMVIGKDENNSPVYMIDKDNDFDFSDETIYFPVDDQKITDSIVQNESHEIFCEYFNNGQILNKKIPLLVSYSYNYFGYSFPVHYQVTVNNKNIFLNSGFGWANFEVGGTNLMNHDEIIQKGEYIIIDGEILKNLGANTNNMTLSLERMPLDSTPYSSQLGFYAHPFKGNVFNTDTNINLEDYQGKYVFLDFWGSWCKPCIDEIENIKYAYENLSSDRIVFIGIAHDRVKSLNNAIKKYRINWPQILSTDNNDLIKLYNLDGFPRSLLIDEKGKIIAENLRGENLLEQIERLIK